jgi:hypothetical protein
MDDIQEVFDPDVLKRLERSYRRHLAKKPEDMGARINLAWCLFMQALHQAGQESILRIFREVDTGTDSQRGNRIRTDLDTDALQLLKECLQQMHTVQQLSLHARERVDVEKLQALIRLSGGERAVVEAEKETLRALIKLAQEILQRSAQSESAAG